MRDPFEKLEPPPGGLTRLRAALDAVERSPSATPWRRWAAVGGAVAAAIVIALGVVAVRSRAGMQPASLVALEQEPPGRDPVSGRDGTAVELVSASPEVVFYRADAYAGFSR